MRTANAAEYFSNFIACNFHSILVESIMINGGKNENIDYVFFDDFVGYVVPGI